MNVEEYWVVKCYSEYVNFMEKNHYDLFSKFHRSNIKPPQNIGGIIQINQGINNSDEDFKSIVDITNGFQQDYLLKHPL